MIERLRRFLSGAALCAVLGLAAAAAPAQTAKYQFDMPSQPLADALRAVAQQTSKNVLFNPALVEGISAPALRAELTLNEAIGHLLAGTPLGIQNVPPDTVVVQLLDRSEPAAKAAVTAALLMARAEEPQSTAQAAEDSPEPSSKGVPEILVKGSRVFNTDIRRTEDDTQPYVIFDSQDIARSGVSSVEDFLKTRLPMNSQSAALNQQGAGELNTGQINLRGMGTEQTLILVDGRRVAGVGFDGPSGIGQPNITGISPSAIERIEVLPATAGGIYGGSATGGVINIILKHDYSGWDFRATYGNTLDSDVGRFDLSLNGGLTLEEGRTRLMLRASRSEQNALLPPERDFRRRSVDRTVRNAPSQIYPGFAAFVASGANVCSAAELSPTFGVCDGSPYGLPSGDPLVLDDGTALGSTFTSVPAGYAGPQGDDGAALALNAGQYDLSTPPNGYPLLQPSDMTSVSANIRRDFGRNVEGFVEFSSTRTVNPREILNTMGIYIPADSPYNPFQQGIQVMFPVPDFPLSGGHEVKTRSAHAGFIARLPRDWALSLEHSRWKTTASLATDLSPEVIVAVSDFDPELNEYLQSIALRAPGSYELDLTPFLTPYSRMSGPFENSMDDTVLRASGPVARLPAGPIVLSGYVEQREQRFANSFADGFIAPTPVTWFPHKSQEVRSYYVESRLPVFSPARSTRFARELELMAAVRRDEYQSRAPGGFGSFDVPARGGPLPQVDYFVNEVESTDYTLGLRYAPVADVVLRASLGTGFVPPNLGQISPRLVNQGWSPFSDPKRGGTPITGTTETIPTIQGGNTNLEPENSESISFGLIFTPRVLEGLRVSADYTKTKKTGEIGGVPPQVLINREDEFPGRITRGPRLPGDPAGWEGPIVQIDMSAINVAATTVEAFDYQLDYELDAGRFGRWRPYAIATRQTELTRRLLPGDAGYDTVGFLGGPLEWRVNFGLTWESGPWTAGWNAQYFDSYSLEYSCCAGAAADQIARQGSEIIPSQTYHDLFAAYDFDKHGPGVSSIFEGAAVTLGIQNVLDKSPPIIAATGGADPGYSTYGDPRMRRFTLMLNKRFGGN